MKKRPVLWIWPVLLTGLLCTLALLFGRVSAETASQNVAAAIRYTDVQLLGETDGRSPAQWLADLRSAGVGFLVFTDADEAESAPLARSAGLQTAREGTAACPGDAFLLPTAPDRGFKGYPSPGDYTGDPSVPVALVENYTRTGAIAPASFDPEIWPGPMVKTLYMYDAYSFHYEPAEPACESENILFRAVTDRSMRLVIVTPLEKEGGGVVADPAVYADMLQGLKERIEARGLSFGDTFSCLSAPTLNRYLLGGAVLFPGTLLVLFLLFLFPVPPLWQTVLLVGETAVALGGSILLPRQMQTLAAFGTAVLTPCFAALLLCRTWKTGGKTNNLALQCFLLLAELLGISLVGGMTVAALLGTRYYLLGFGVFTGVKLAQALPLLVGAGLLFATLRAYPAEHIRKLPVGLILLILVIAAGALVLVLLRSGDNMLPVAQAELAARTWLEQTLYARPRSKEMLLAFPALAAYVALCARRIPILALPAGVLALVGSVSVVNTLCHTFTPVLLSVIRTLLGAGIGFGIGLLVLGLVCWIVRKDPPTP